VAKRDVVLEQAPRSTPAGERRPTSHNFDGRTTWHA
jgi:hypothetical protein